MRSGLGSGLASSLGRGLVRLLRASVMRNQVRMSSMMVGLCGRLGLRLQLCGGSIRVLGERFVT